MRAFAASAEHWRRLWCGGPATIYFEKRLSFGILGTLFIHLFLTMGEVVGARHFKSLANQTNCHWTSIPHSGSSVCARNAAVCLPQKQHIALIPCWPGQTTPPSRVTRDTLSRVPCPTYPDSFLFFLKAGFTTRAVKKAGRAVVTSLCLMPKKAVRMWVKCGLTWHRLCCLLRYAPCGKLHDTAKSHTMQI